MGHSLPPAADEFDIRLRDLAHPEDWRNPIPTGRYNLVVLGGGTAGLIAAAGAAGLGAKVALIERRLLGGDCLNSGCVPSKALIRSARAAASVRLNQQFGIHPSGDMRVDFSAVMQRLRRLRSELANHDSASRFAKLGVDVYLGEGRFSADDTIEVSDQKLQFHRAVIATGASPMLPAIAGLDADNVLTSETVFSLTSLPRRLAVIGGGPVGCELAQAFARLGSRVILIETSTRILDREDADAAELVFESLVRDGVDVHLGTTVESGVIALDSTAAPVQRLSLSSSSGPRQIEVDRILVGTGRKPNVAGLNLDLAHVNFDDIRGIHVDDRLRTTNPRIYAAGDVCSLQKLTHAADFMARIVLQNALFLGRLRVSHLIIPTCLYTSPEVAQIGLTEESARDRGIRVEVFMQSLDHNDRALLDGDSNGFVKILVKAGTDRIVGATIVAPHSGEMIGELVLAMTNRIGLRRLAQAIHPYPTVAEAIRKCGDAYNRARLTPSVRRLLDFWLSWIRR